MEPRHDEFERQGGTRAVVDGGAYRKKAVDEHIERSSRAKAANI
jgi:hypothetical protein